MAKAKKAIAKIIPEETIIRKVYNLREQKVLLDVDLAVLYGVETKRLKEAVRRNIERFPDDFMFELTETEYKSLRSQFATSNRGGARYMPYAFTEQGVAMLSGILNSDKAIAMNIAIMRAFVEVRKVLLQDNDLKTQLKEIREKLGEHDVQLNQIYDAMENLLDEKAAQKNGKKGKGSGLRNKG